jgi:hypothetical protein
LEVLRHSPMAPKMRTDCLALLKMARQGTEEAVRPNRPLARIWRDIGFILDGDTTVLDRLSLLVWQPAHQTVQAIGQRTGSDGRKITTVDWRANRLVDALAKQGAEIVRASREIRNLVESGKAASLHAACNLGRVTFAANNHKVEKLDDKGQAVTVVSRDAEPAPRRKRPAEEEGKNGKAKAKAVPKFVANAGAVKRPCETAEDLDKSREQKRPCGKALQRAARVETDKAALKRNVEQRGSQLRQASAEPAALRMERLHKRVRLRLGGESTAVLE